jgi:D-glycero-D-manno-heptose 1,7-bisphosphate phosphatase
LNKAVFLDRDGVLNKDPPHFAHRLDQLELIHRSGTAVKLLNELGYLVIIISNQSGVARGYYTEKEVSIFNNALLIKIQEFGGMVDDVYYCPHHPDAIVEKYKIDCQCRKPRPGMLLRAAKEHHIDLQKSYVIGDKLSDIEAGKNAGCQTILVLTGHGTDESLSLKDDNCPVAPDLYEAVNTYIMRKNNLTDCKDI